MPMDFAWADDRQTIFHVRFIGTWTWDEYSAMLKQSRELVTQVQHDYFILADFTASAGHIPSNLITHFRDIAENAYEHRKGIVIISKQGRLVKSLMEVFIRLIRINYSLHVVSSYEEAIAIVADALDRTRD